MDAREKAKNDPANGQSQNQRASSVKQLKAPARCSRILPTACDVGAKKNSKGFKETWVGLSCASMLPAAKCRFCFVLTSASVHDSQVAIPLMTMTSARVFYLYDLMDAAYDAAAIHDQSRALGHAPIVDRNFRADHQAKAEWGREVERMKLIHMPNFDDVIYDFRTMAERVNARLKDEFASDFSASAAPPRSNAISCSELSRSLSTRSSVSSTTGPPLPRHCQTNFSGRLWLW